MIDTSFTTARIRVLFVFIRGFQVKGSNTENPVGTKPPSSAGM